MHLLNAISQSKFLKSLKFATHIKEKDMENIVKKPCVQKPSLPLVTADYFILILVDQTVGFFLVF